MDIAKFRASFPEFVDESVYTDGMLGFWSGVGEKMLNARRWDDLLEEGLFLFVAHHASLAAIRVGNSEFGDNPDSGLERISNKSLDGVSVSYDTSSTALNDAGNYNATSYGRQFWQLAMIVGTGGYQI